jgi:hypothetical protein
MAFERKQKVVTPSSEPPARQQVVLPTEGLLSACLEILDIPYEGHHRSLSLTSKLGYHYTCDKMIGAGMRQIPGGDHFSACYESVSGRVLKVQKHKAMKHTGQGIHGYEYVEVVTIS